MQILSTILLRLWFLLTIPPSGRDLLATLILLLVYWVIVFPLGWRWALVDLEPIQVWWSLQLYRYRLHLYHNRQAAKLMVLLLGWVVLEELVLRVSFVPLLLEKLPDQQRLAWIVGAGILAIARYILLYCRFHRFFGQLSVFMLAILLDLACLATYILTESLWLTVFFHWLVLVFWLLVLGGLYQLRQYSILSGDQKI